MPPIHHMSTQGDPIWCYNIKYIYTLNVTQSQRSTCPFFVFFKPNRNFKISQKYLNILKKSRGSKTCEFVTDQ